MNVPPPPPVRPTPRPAPVSPVIVARFPAPGELGIGPLAPVVPTVVVPPPGDLGIEVR